MSAEREPAADEVAADTRLSTGDGGQRHRSVDERPAEPGKTDIDAATGRVDAHGPVDSRLLDGGEVHHLGEDADLLDSDLDSDLDPELDADADADPDADSDEAPAGSDLASSVLAGARAAARGRARRDPNRRRATRRENLAGRNRGGYSAAGPDPVRDPQLLGPLLAGLVEDQGWQRPIAEGTVFAEWSRLVGPDIAAHSAPQSLRDGELRIVAESTAWATQLRLLASSVLARLVAELGPEVVTKLIITGPTAPSWKHGGRSVRGARGPRDTYG